MKTASIRIQVPLVTEAQPALQEVEVATSLQIPFFQLIGLPAPEVGEARERVRAAICASGFEFPRRRILVNLSPASVRKRGTGIDLGIALAVMASSLSESIYPAVCWGELGLDGQVRPVGSVARALVSAWRSKADRLLLSLEDADTALKLLPHLPQVGELQGPPPQILAIDSLAQAWEQLRSAPSKAPRPQVQATGGTTTCSLPPPAQLLKLSAGLERVLCLAAAGGHHLLLLGPKGSGKSHALEWLRWLTPPATPQERLERLLMSELQQSKMPRSVDQFADVPFRRVGTQIRPSSLCGSYAGGLLNPGEVSLAHGGVLVIDEMPELARDAREALRGPLETGQVHLHSTAGQTTLPARFQLAATGNLCPCGNWTPASDLGLPCYCGVTPRTNYLARIDSPVLDRIDLTYVLTSRPNSGTLSAEQHRLWARVQKTREQLIRTWGSPSAGIEAHRIETSIQYSVPSHELSLRARHKTFRIALTIAAWEGRSEPIAADLAEALTYRFARDSR